MPKTRNNKSKLIRTRKHKMSAGGLRSSYGTILLPKGLRLYHASASHLCQLPENSIKPVLFMTLHPSEWFMEGASISVIELQRDITLLFMIKHIHRLRIISSLNNFLGKPNSNLAKMNYDNIKKWIPNLQQELLDGWISSIENKMAIEFAIINNASNLKLIECLPIEYNWANLSYNNNMNIIPKNWGTTYSIHTKLLPVQMNLHERFRTEIEAYKRRIQDEDPDGTAFSLLLKNASISYFNGPVNAIQWSL